MRALATWSFRHRRLVVAGWIVALVAISGISRAVGTAYSNDFSLPDTESTRAIDLLTSVAPASAGDTDQIVFATTDGTKVTDASVQAKIEPMLAEVAKLPHVTNVQSPYGDAGAGQVSEDGTVGFATVTFDVQAQDVSLAEAKRFVNTARSAASPTLTVGVSGQVASQATPPSVGGTGFGIIAAGVVLFIVFGSLFAMLLPLASALISLGTALGVIGLLSHVLGMPDFSSELVLLIGLGVGIDYALFIVSRHRQGLLAGRDVESSVVVAIDTSGRAVLFAGIIVCIALLGMFALGISFLYGLAIAASIGVLFTMAAALTLLPALLGFLGPKVLSRRQRRKLATAGPVGIAEGRLLVPMGGHGRTTPDRLRRRGARRDRRARGAVPLAPAGLLGRGERSGGLADTDRVRPPGEGIRARLQRAAPDHGAAPTARGTRRRCSASRRPSPRDPGSSP